MSKQDGGRDPMYIDVMIRHKDFSLLDLSGHFIGEVSNFGPP